MLEIGQIVDGKYKVLNKIGQGGMSIVYLAMNEKANKQWAIKEVRKDGTQDFEIVKQGLIAETDMLKKLRHPNLPSIVDIIEEEDTFLIVMDYIEGNSLSAALKEYGALPQEKVIAWAKQLCDVLTYLHSREPAIIYRDMKPSNVMLKPDGNICLIDFGTAREYKENSAGDTTVLGTRGYAAPEQYGGKGQTDARTDIYSLGATMYHLVTGHNPALPPYELYPIRKWNPALSAGLEEIILKCTQSNPDDRFQSCAELMYALAHYDALDHSYRAKQKRRLALFAATAALTALCAGGAAYCGIREQLARKNTYSSYITQADEQVELKNYEQAYDIYKTAVSLNPEREEAYTGILAMYRSDGVFTKDEAQSLLNVLSGYGYSDTRDNRAYFMKNREGYASFCYNLAFAYLLQYTEAEEADSLAECEGNAAQAVTYFGYVCEEYADVATPIQLQCAAHLGSLARDEANREKASLNMVGAGSVDYAQTYQTMKSIIEDDLAAEPGYEEVALEACYRILCNAGNWRVSFKNGGITYEEMLELIEQTYTYAVQNIPRTEEREALFVLLEQQREISVQAVIACYNSGQQLEYKEE